MESRKGNMYRRRVPLNNILRLRWYCFLFVLSLHQPHGPWCRLPRQQGILRESSIHKIWEGFWVVPWNRVITLQPLGADQSTIPHMKGNIHSFHMKYISIIYSKRLQSYGVHTSLNNCSLVCIKPQKLTVGELCIVMYIWYLWYCESSSYILFLFL